MRTLPSLRSGRFRPEPRAARVLPGGRLPSPDPPRCFGVLRLPQRSVLTDAKKRLGPPSATGVAASASGAVGSASGVRWEALGRFLCVARHRGPYNLRWAAQLAYPCLDGKGGPLAWRRRKSETSCLQVETRSRRKTTVSRVSGSFRLLPRSFGLGTREPGVRLLVRNPVRNPMQNLMLNPHQS